MDVIVIGAGAVGMLVSSFLAEANQNVTVVTRRQAQMSQIQQFGLLRKNLDQSFTKTVVQTTTELYNIPKNAFVIIAVKYGQLKDIYPILSALHTDIPLLFLQNGLAHFEEALQLPQKTIAFGSCQFGAQKENDHTVNHRGQGVMKIAIERGNHKLFEWFSQLENVNFPVEFVVNAEQMLFEKALLNCFINPLTAILKVKNGELLENQHAFSLLENLYYELMDAFPEQRSHLAFDDVIHLCKRTATNTSSMLSDCLHHRPMEIETIVGAILKKASKVGKQVPTLNTLYHVLLVLEENGEKM